MTTNVISIAPDSSILEALRLMLQHRISGLPVIDSRNNLVGIVTEGDFLRRAETGTERKRSRWLEFLAGPGRLAHDYVHSHGCKIDEIMTSDVQTAAEDTELDDIVAMMERFRIKRLPILRGREVVGIVSRANLLHALAGLAREAAPSPKSDETIRDGIIAELDRQNWAPKHMIDVVVRNGAVELWGNVFAPDQRDAARVAAESVPGVKSVKSHIVWIEPMSGMAFPDPSDEASDAALKVTAAPGP
jgi:CBS domain-containing protein